MRPQECCVLIPSLFPDEKLPAYVKELLAADFGLILVVDDGSAPEYQPIFSRIAGWDRCAVTHHEVNKARERPCAQVLRISRSIPRCGA